MPWKMRYEEAAWNHQQEELLNDTGNFNYLRDLNNSYDLNVSTPNDSKRTSGSADNMNRSYRDRGSTGRFFGETIVSSKE